jgi:hypothetical protein
LKRLRRDIFRIRVREQPLEIADLDLFHPFRLLSNETP